jgi:hypothetical protein
VNPDPRTRTAPRAPYDAVLYAKLYRNEEPRIRAVARGVRAGRLSQAEGRERVLVLFAALIEQYREAVSVNHL